MDYWGPGPAIWPPGARRAYWGGGGREEREVSAAHGQDRRALALRGDAQHVTEVGSEHAVPPGLDERRQVLLEYGRRGGVLVGPLGVQAPRVLDLVPQRLLPFERVPAGLDVRGMCVLDLVDEQPGEPAQVGRFRLTRTQPE